MLQLQMRMLEVGVVEDPIVKVALKGPVSETGSVSLDPQVVKERFMEAVNKAVLGVEEMVQFLASSEVSSITTGPTPINKFHSRSRMSNVT